MSDTPLDPFDDGRDPHGRFAEGNPGGPGRPSGSPNKTSQAVTEDILSAYERRGGIEYLVCLDDVQFVRLLNRVLPRQVKAEVEVARKGDPITDWEAISDDELQRRAQCLDAIVARVDGKTVFYDNPDLMFSATDAWDIIHDIEAARAANQEPTPNPVAKDYLRKTIEALKGRLPVLQSLIPRAEAALAVLADDQE